MSTPRPAERRTGRGLMLVSALLTAGIVTTGCLLLPELRETLLRRGGMPAFGYRGVDGGRATQWRTERLEDGAFFQNAIFAALVRRAFDHPDDAETQRELRVVKRASHCPRLRPPWAGRASWKGSARLAAPSNAQARWHHYERPVALAVAARTARGPVVVCVHCSKSQRLFHHPAQT